MSCQRVKLGVAALGAMALAAAVPPSALGQASDEAYNTIKRLGSAMERCWFASADPSFAPYAYSPEPNASSGARILIVNRNAPQDPPALVIELTASRGINAFGALATSPLAPRIGADLKRWLSGSEACS